MKLASLKSGRDGRLVVVSRDLSRCVLAEGIAPTLQSALDEWTALAPQLAALAARLEAGNVAAAKPFDPRLCAAPATTRAPLGRRQRLREPRGTRTQGPRREMPASFWTDPLIYQGGSDDLLGPTDDAAFASEDFGIDLGPRSR